MLNVQAEISDILTAFICAALPCEPPRITPRSERAELAAPLEYACKMPASECAGLLIQKNAASPAMFLGAPLLRGIAVSGGYVCFSITADAYYRAMRHIINSCPLPPLPNQAESDAEYALCRMLMLSRQPSGPFPDDRAVRGAMWSAFGIVGAASAGLAAARAEAAHALLHMLDGVGAPERAKLRLGDVGGCAARLLAIHPILEDKI